MSYLGCTQFRHRTNRIQEPIMNSSELASIVLNDSTNGPSYPLIAANKHALRNLQREIDSEIVIQAVETKSAGQNEVRDQKRHRRHSRSPKTSQPTMRKTWSWQAHHNRCNRSVQAVTFRPTFVGKRLEGWPITSFATRGTVMVEESGWTNKS